jgi:hypothetical protein
MTPSLHYIILYHPLFFTIKSWNLTKLSSRLTISFSKRLLTFIQHPYCQTSLKLKHIRLIALRDLVFYIAVSNDPYRVKTLASVVVTIGQSSDAPSFTHTLAELLSLELAGTHFLFNDDNDTAYGTYLLESLLSGNLTSTSTMYAYFEKGLKASRGLEESEVLVVGTCIL